MVSATAASKKGQLLPRGAYTSGLEKDGVSDGRKKLKKKN
jgi:hypothetical protein